MTPPEKLKAAARRLLNLDDEAAQGPWVVGRSEIDDTVIRFREAELAVVHMEADAHLIATLRPVAGLAPKLHEAAGRWESEVVDEATRTRVVTRHVKFCGGDLLLDGSPLGDGWPETDRCRCFDGWLALADAVLAATP